jgi:uncharacterized metal-binding protein YceD (DUF177 family)
MSVALQSKFAYRVSDLPNNSIKKFDLRPAQAQHDAIAATLNLLGLRKLRFTGQIQSSGKSDWRLTGTIGATIIQPCTITLEPITTRIDEPVERLFVKEITDWGGEEIEMPEDDTIEPLGTWIDAEAIMMESLCLALPEYPRAEGATLGESVYTQPGKAPMRDEDARPFADLAALKDLLNSGDE